MASVLAMILVPALSNAVPFDFCCGPSTLLLFSTDAREVSAANHCVLASRGAPSQERFKGPKPPERARKENDVLASSPPKPASGEITQAFARCKQNGVLIKWAAVNCTS